MSFISAAQEASLMLAHCLQDFHLWTDFPPELQQQKKEDYRQWQQRQVQKVETLVNTILSESDTLSQDQIVTLLMLKAPTHSGDGYGLIVALSGSAALRDEVGAVQTYLQLILASSKLSAKQKIEVLSVQSLAMPALFYPCLFGFKHAMHAFMDAVLASSLSISQKQNLLAIPERDGRHWFFIPLRTRMDLTRVLLKEYIEKIVTTPHLNLAAKKALLSEKSGPSFLQAAFREANQEVLKFALEVFDALMQTAALSPAEKKELIAPNLAAWLEFALQTNQFDAIHDYTQLLLRTGVELNKDELGLLKEAAKRALAQRTEVSWKTVHWLGLAYEPDLILNKKDMPYVENMKTIVPIEGMSAELHLQRLVAALKSGKLCKEIMKISPVLETSSIQKGNPKAALVLFNAAEQASQPVKSVTFAFDSKI